ncbi:hypothetical protein [Cupriavidus nantongensis]|uniref:hypothetical protein n=1 Tax=Cupriavidus nantongensis TaxID=1796606 RepID=UPI00224708F9|nr:hypothetical protein [Cupriavidus nantongensis]
MHTDAVSICFTSVCYWLDLVCGGHIARLASRAKMMCSFFADPIIWAAAAGDKTLALPNAFAAKAKIWKRRACIGRALAASVAAAETRDTRGAVYHLDMRLRRHGAPPYRTLT